ncbi:MAG: alpha/beta hydrolase [Flavobacterium sp.]
MEGGLISGSKEQVGNYCNILASEGYVVISIDYSLAPESKYPKPLVQLNNALHFISNNAEQFHIDSSSIFLAGDSGGSMITAQVANIITNPDYAKLLNIKPKIHEKQLKGLLLYCGIYEIENLNTDGNFGSFLNNVVWSYFGKKEIKEDKFAKTASITNYLTINFPPSFISAGNTDPLLPQSKLLAQKLTHKNVIVDSLFFPEKRKPDLGHEYQFTFNEDGREAFKRSLIFLKTHRK